MIRKASICNSTDSIWKALALLKKPMPHIYMAKHGFKLQFPIQATAGLPLSSTRPFPSIGLCRRWRGKRWRWSKWFLPWRVRLSPSLTVLKYLAFSFHQIFWGDYEAVTVQLPLANSRLIEPWIAYSSNSSSTIAWCGSKFRLYLNYNCKN